jgi:hypothetical protein
MVQTEPGTLKPDHRMRPLRELRMGQDIALSALPFNGNVG